MMVDWEQVLKETAKFALETWAREGGTGPTQIFQMRLGTSLANLGTAEAAITAFRNEEGLAREKPEWFAREMAALEDMRINLVLQVAARTLLYCIALKQNREKEDGNEARAGAGDRVRGGS